jgi:hypothetical protein
MSQIQDKYRTAQERARTVVRFELHWILNQKFIYFVI